ncbi:tRNA (adenosine(37)-N6)-threonylcarbamoyltransferase complex dimerization subunit type 1 TsaB [Flavimarina sp. Hel_I_48]|uniref:tRNA (adenosine(37)-N6)-threonylcarbamoyltransferase complex dimerization subunit type 1 TsaB n=1 Tax=Flavimarina sp. Hel_I_48 TaxID=1392488 RepID=UPI0004DEF9AE|nr:tRNA (adenosine(37)-N6)-threonylcarbamoyltransferase complex dimerization subunit type 1 TsaB [Flavimarina sp. Hel_I_48]
MSLILCLETTTTNCSVALSQMGKTIALKEDLSEGYSHGELLHQYIAAVLKEAGYSLKDLNAVAVSKGPGSYTGLRIGVSSAKGLCYAHEIPLIAIETLKSLASQVNLEGIQNIIPLLDARRMEVYSAVYDSAFAEIRETRAEIIDENSFTEYLDRGKTVFIGNGVEKFKSICKHSNALFIIDALPSAREMASLAEHAFQDKKIEDLAYFEPYYLKDFMVTQPKKKS